MKIATSLYRPGWHADLAALEGKLDGWVAEAAGQGAELLLFPEYGGIEIAMLGARADNPPATVWRDRMAAGEGAWLDLHRRLARRHHVHILAGSLCAATPEGVVNRAWLVAPDGSAVAQDKLILTPYEREDMGLVAGRDLRVFDTALGAIGVLICYDCEFPLLARAQVEAGAQVILVPSATDLAAGLTRVRQSCRARAIEGQCLVVQSPVLGSDEPCEILGTGTGRAGIFCPPDHGLPPDGIIAQGALDLPGWVVAEVDPAAIAAPRRSGQVGNFAHWGEQDSRVNLVTRQRLG